MHLQFTNLIETKNKSSLVTEVRIRIPSSFTRNHSESFRNILILGILGISRYLLESSALLGVPRNRLESYKACWNLSKNFRILLEISIYQTVYIRKKTRRLQKCIRIEHYLSKLCNNSYRIIRLISQNPFCKYNCSKVSKYLPSVGFHLLQFARQGEERFALNQHNN